MKKLPFYLLCVGMLAASTVVSCVKNDESASVTNLRNAKTEQLQSIAAMNLATAKATEIKAVADVKLTEAKAAYELAVATGKQIEVDLAKATLAKKIEAALLQADASLEMVKLSFLQALNAYNAYVAANPNPFLDALVSAYETQMSFLSGDLSAVNNAKAGVLILQAGIVDAKSWLATQTASANNDIIKYQAQLDAYNAIPANDRPAAYKAWQEALVKIETINAGLKTVVDPVNAINKAVADNIKLSDATAYVLAVDAAVDATIPNTLEYTYVDYAGVESAEQSSSIVVDGKPVATQSSEDLSMDEIVVVPASAGGLPTYRESSTLKSYSTVKVDAILLNQQISKLTGGLVAPKKAYDDAVKAAVAAAGDKTLAALKTAVVTAQAAYNKALVADVAADIATTKTALDEATGKVDAFDNSVSQQYNAWAKLTAELAMWNAWGAELSATNKTAYDAAVKAITDEFAKYDAAYKAYGDVAVNVTAQKAIAADLQALYNGLVDKEALVAKATQTLDKAKVALAGLVSASQAPDAKEAALAIANKQVAAAELALAVTQKQVDTLKAQIDAELKK